MDEAVRQALERDRTIDITTTGRNTGQPRLKEIWFHNIEGRLYITGTPGSRDWYANLVANAQFTFHLKQSAQADLAARATSIRDRDRRRDIISRTHQRIGGNSDLEAWVEGSPLVEVELLRVSIAGGTDSGAGQPHLSQQPLLTLPPVDCPNSTRPKSAAVVLGRAEVFSGPGKGFVGTSSGFESDFFVERAGCTFQRLK